MRLLLPDIQTRSHSLQVGDSVEFFRRVWAAGLTTCAKHFPSRLGTVTTASHAL